VSKADGIYSATDIRSGKARIEGIRLDHLSVSCQ